MIQTKFLDAAAALPFRANQTDAGADLRSNMDANLYPNEMLTVSTGIAVKIPSGYVGLVFSRSGMGKKGVTLANSVGVIDADYRGELKVMLQNSGSDVFKIERGDRIAQLVLLPIITPDFIEYTGTEEAWADTSRGVGGFGSTGFQ